VLSRLTASICGQLSIIPCWPEPGLLYTLCFWLPCGAAVCSCAADCVDVAFSEGDGAALFCRQKQKTEALNANKGNGTPWDHSLVRKRKFHPLLKKLGIPQCGFHAFRHGNATLLDQISAPMAVRLNRLGHAEAQTTMGYTHAVTADERRVANEVGGILHGTARNEQEERLAPNGLTLTTQYYEVGCGACNHPNVPSIPFSFELHPNHLKRKP